LQQWHQPSTWGLPKMSRNCILSVTELSYYYICHFYMIYRICSYAEAAFIKTIAVFTASSYNNHTFYGG
jgi:hypothetical protein